MLPASTLDDQAETARQLDATFRRLPSALFSFPILGALVSWIFWNLVSHQLLLTWIATLCLATLVGLLASWAYARRVGSPDRSTWVALRVTLAMFNGLAFAMAGTLLFVPGDLGLQSFMLLLIAGSAAVSVTSSSGHLPSLLAYLTSAVVPAALRLAWEGDSVHFAMSGFAFVYYAVLMGVGINNNRQETRACQLDLQNRKLIDELANANQLLNQRVAERTAELQGLLEQYRESRAKLSRFHVLLEHSGVGVFLAEPEGLQIIDCNQAACKLLGRDEILGLTLPQLNLNPQLNSPAAWRANLGKAPILIERPDEGITVELTADFQEFEDMRYVLVVVRDTSERVRMEGRLRQSQKMEAVGRLAGGIAHDFNNILTAIMGLANLIIESQPKGSDTGNDAEEIIQVASRAASLTKKLLAFSRSGLDLPTTLDLNEAVREVIQLLRRTLGGDIELVAVLSETPCPVRMAAGEIDQIVVNLAVNARDAMPQGGVLTVEVQESPTGPGGAAGPWVMLSISDTGCGMDAQVQDRMFEPFFTTKGQQGHGLGLATCFGIVTRAGGQISVNSERGQGSRFCILLPRDGQPLAALPTRRLEESPANGRKARILVIEDQEAVLKMVRRLLEHQAYEVLQARSAEEALALYRGLDRPLDLVLTDIILPGMSGVDFCRRIGRDGPALLLMSGYTEQAPTLDSESLPLLHKPFLPRELVAKVANVLATRRAGP